MIWMKPNSYWSMSGWLSVSISNSPLARQAGPLIAVSIEPPVRAPNSLFGTPALLKPWVR